MQPRFPLRVAVLPRNSQSMELSGPDQRMIIHPVRRRGPPEKFSPTARANAGSAMLHLRRSTGGGDALPFAIRHLQPKCPPSVHGHQLPYRCRPSLCLATHRQRSPCSQTWSPLRSPMSLTCQLLPLTIVSNWALPCMVPRRRFVPGWRAGRGRGICARCRSRREFALASLRLERISSGAPDLFAIPTSGASLVAVTIITDSREE